ncbi:MAG: UDP-N-acetylmuramate dehydrogenase [Christensenellales bacterium]|jgi:UDP-N-acetylmuramate dehydrogenase
MDISVFNCNGSLMTAENMPGWKLSFFGSGGNIRLIIMPVSPIQTAWAVDKLKGAPHYIIGSGTNTLISDSGVDEPVISTSRLINVSRKKNIIYAGAGVRLSVLANYAKKAELSGLEKLSGIPGSLGGALKMNAGAYGRDIGSLINCADILIDGRIERIAASEMGFSYRRSKLLDKGGIALGAEIELSPDSYDNIVREESRVKTLRINSQPKERSLGSVFKAHSGIPAAKYIEELKLKGLRAGGAEISKMHCNFIVNISDATTADFITLARLIQDRVYEKFNILLETEIAYIGEPNEDFRRLSHPYGT